MEYRPESVKPRLMDMPKFRESLQVFPKPASSQILSTLTIAGKTHIDYHIYDLAGRQVKEINGGFVYPGSYRKFIDISDLQSGTYILMCKTAYGVCHTKFIKL